MGRKHHPATSFHRGKIVSLCADKKAHSGDDAFFPTVFGGVWIVKRGGG